MRIGIDISYKGSFRASRATSEVDSSKVDSFKATYNRASR